MQPNTRVVTCALDGFRGLWDITKYLRTLFLDPCAQRYVGMIKLEDALYFPGVGPAIVGQVQRVLQPYGYEGGVFLDLKLLRLSRAARSILRQYAGYQPRVVTVAASVSLETMRAVREALPDTKIAIVDVPSDISEEECRQRWQMMPSERIYETLWYWKDKGVDSVVCAAADLGYLRSHFGDRFEYYVTGIRSAYVPQGEQERTLSVTQALEEGATTLVTGTHLAYRYCDQTWNELDRYFGLAQAV